MQTMTGLQALDATFATARSQRRAAFMPFWTIGYPDLPTSLDMIERLVAVGGDIIEVGVPFSDPLADGPTVQHSSQVSLNNGTTLKDCIAAVRTLRQRGVRVPLILMGYLNPLLAYGLERYVPDSLAAGANGFIVPDLPPEEAGDLATWAEKSGMAAIPLLAPTSTAERIRQAVARASGFVYVVSVTGVTGARDSLPADSADYMRRVRALTTLPLVWGVGISQPEQVSTIAKLADGVVVGSALIRTLEKEGPQAVEDLARSLRAACETHG